ncbi:hypothetical protein IWQ62_005072 [Dispira parvispora]|uniref:G-patch domain-containing protein n=1 Tax=Dispira parvispora TaxID=1520584 RepID=A0A9W8E4U8_9FUNG|nr:hypothetical protein IWQ62_005072 [Dispira parvispora]
MGLAEPKNRQTYSDDPNNKAWLNDKSNFGFRLLQKMGWKEGKGLGAKEDGITKHLGVAKKRDNLGVGADHNTAENWLENTTGYSALLERLNQTVSDTKSESTRVRSDKGDDDEGASKKSKKSKKDKSKKRKKSEKSKDKSKKRKREEGDVSTDGKAKSKTKRNRSATTSATSSRGASDDDASGAITPAEPTPQPSSVTTRPVRLGHRAKFLRSKRMSTLDSNCLNEILGVKAVPRPSSSLETSTPIPKPKGSTNVPMTTSTLNSATYFASKNEQLSKALGKLYPANRFQKNSETPALGISS